MLIRCALRLFFLVLMVSPAVHGAPVESSSELLRTVDRYSQRPSLGPSIVVQGWSLSFGRMNFRMDSGTLFPLLSGGRTLGFHFKGKASFAYRSEDALERASLTSNYRKNLTRATGRVHLTEVKDHLELTEDIASFTLWKAGPEVVLPAGMPTQAVEKSFDSDWAFFQREGLGDRGHAFAAHLANTPDRTLVRAEITGEDSPFVYTLDEGHGRRECLWSVAGPARPAVYGGLRLALLSEQPIGWSWKAPLSPLITLTAVDIDINAGKDGAEIKVKETLVAGEERVGVLTLELYNIADRVFNQGVYQVARVLDVDGRSLPFHHRNDTLLVELGQPRPAGQPFTLTFEYGGRILIRPSGNSYWSLGVEPWFPQPDMGGQAYTVRALIRTPKDDVPVACGRTIRREQSADRNLLEVRIDRPVQFFSLFAGAYSFTEESKDGLTIRVAAYANRGGGQQKRLIAITRQTIEFYVRLFEAFPFEEFNIVQVNSWGFGQAPPGMMIITNEAFDGKMDDLSKLFTRGINERFAHEIAHQYWGHLVKMPSAEDQWVTESFSNYASALAMRSMKGQGESAFEGLLSGWRSQASGYAGSSSIPFANRLRWIDDPYGSFLARTSLLYEKGALLLATLHKEMGDRAFALFMKSIIANFRWRTVTTASIEQLATMAGGKDFSPLFRDCFWGTKMPR